MMPNQSVIVAHCCSTLSGEGGQELPFLPRYQLPSMVDLRLLVFCLQHFAKQDPRLAEPVGNRDTTLLDTSKVEGEGAKSYPFCHATNCHSWLSYG
jgi:hypothetical protein